MFFFLHASTLDQSLHAGLFLSVPFLHTHRPKRCSKSTRSRPTGRTTRTSCSKWSSRASSTLSCRTCSFCATRSTRLRYTARRDRDRYMQSPRFHHNFVSHSLRHACPHHVTFFQPSLFLISYRMVCHPFILAPLFSPSIRSPRRSSARC